MRRIICVCFLTCWMFTLCYGQYEVSPYWKLSKIERNRVDSINLKNYAIITLDSLSMDTIRKFLFHFSDIDPAKIFFSPDYYGIEAVINDSLNNYGIYFFGLKSSHQYKHIFYKELNSIFIVMNQKDIVKKNFIRNSKDFYTKHEANFPKKSKYKMVRKINRYYRKYKNSIAVPMVN